MNEAMWAVLSEWEGINIEVKTLVSGLFVTNWETFMSYDCVKGGNEYLGLGECGLRGKSGKLEES